MEESTAQENKVHPIGSPADTEQPSSPVDLAGEAPPIVGNPAGAAAAHSIPATVNLVLPSAPEPDPSGPLSTRQLEAFVSLMKVIIWPLVILFFFWMLHAPLTRIIDILPDKLLASTKVSVGSLSFEIQQSAKAAGSPELAQLISGLSPLAIDQLLNTARSNIQLAGSAGAERRAFTMPTDSQMGALLELEKKGLLQFKTSYAEFDRFLKSLPAERDDSVQSNRLWYRLQRSLTSEEEKQLYDQEYSLTDRGKRVFDLIVVAVSQELQQPSPPKAETEK